MYVCKTCRSERVWIDAHVNANDETEVETFDSYYCEKCDGETTLVSVGKSLAAVSDVLKVIFPSASFGEDNDGQLIIYTDYKVQGDTLVPLTQED